MMARRTTELGSLTFLWAVCLIAPAGLRAQTWSMQDGLAEFTSKVPLHEFKGRSDHLTGQISLADSTVDFYLDLETLETGLGKRDRDMRLTLDTETYPFAEFFGKLISPFDPTRSGEQPARVRGAFRIHGVSRDLDVLGTLEKRDDNVLLKAAWVLNLKEYDIEPPSLLIIRVDEEQDIRIEATLTSGSIEQ